MFFNQDLLFNKGPLSIIWMAGNEEFGSKTIKSKRNKHYQLVLDAKLVPLCDQIRNHFPEMGTANGMSLKKISTLIKGMGFVYFTKMENLARNIIEMQFRLKASGATRLMEINLPVAGLDHCLTDGEQMEEQALMGFGCLEDMDNADFLDVRCVGRLSPETPVRARDRYLGTPLPQGHHEQTPNTPEEVVRKRKRKEGVREKDVLKLLKSLADQTNPQANCIPEDPQISSRPVAFDVDMGFNDDELANHGTMSPNKIELVNDAAEGLGSPLNRLSTESSKDDGQGRTGRRNMRPVAIEDDYEIVQELSQPRIDIPRIELEPIVDDDVRPRRAKKRKRLVIDAQIAIPIEELRNGLITDRETEPMKVASKTLQSKNFFFEEHGRKCGSTLVHFLREELKIRAGRPTSPIADPNLPQQDISEVRDVLLPENVEADASKVATDPVDPSVPHGPDSHLPEENDDFQDKNMIAPNQDLENFPDVNQDFGNFSEASYKNPEIRIDDQPKTFKMMFPLETTSKRQAASGFAKLLRLMGKNKVVLEQEVTYGDIYVASVGSG